MVFHWFLAVVWIVKLVNAQVADYLIQMGVPNVRKGSFFILEIVSQASFIVGCLNISTLNFPSQLIYLAVSIAPMLATLVNKPKI